MDDFDEAVMAELLIPFKMAYGHPAIHAGSAASLGMDVDTFKDRAIHGYGQAREQTQVLSFEMYRDAVIYGQNGEMDWAVVSYTLQLGPNFGIPFAPNCHRLVIFGTPDEAYITTAGVERADAIAVAAVPALGPVLAQVPAVCD